MLYNDNGLLPIMVAIAYFVIDQSQNHMHKPGINHLEIWVNNIPETMSFFAPILETIGWHKVNDYAFATDSLEIYFQENPAAIVPGSGVRHICFQATTNSPQMTIFGAKQA